jgi:hypothetical protein
MAVHDDTNALLMYTPNRYPSIPGSEAAYFTGELKKVSNALAAAVAVIKLLEKRMNDNGLT